MLFTAFQEIHRSRGKYDIWLPPLLSYLSVGSGTATSSVQPWVSSWHPSWGLWVYSWGWNKSTTPHFEVKGYLLSIHSSYTWRQEFHFWSARRREGVFFVCLFGVFFGCFGFACDGKDFPLSLYQCSLYSLISLTFNLSMSELYFPISCDTCLEWVGIIALHISPSPLKKDDSTVFVLCWWSWCFSLQLFPLRDCEQWKIRS